MKKDQRYVYTYEDWMERQSDIPKDAIIITPSEARALCKAHGHTWQKVGSSDKRDFYRCRICREWKEVWT